MMDYDGKHKRRLYQHLKEVERLFERLIVQTSSIAIKLKLKEELFRFKKHPKAIKDINKVLNEYQNSLLDTIQVGIQKEWHLANEKVDALQKGMLQKIVGQVPKEVLLSEFQKIARSPRNTEALKSFQERKVGDFTLSDRVWKITSQMREELEFAIDVSFTEGKSANELAREIKKLLNEPDRLYRRVRDKHGNLVLSKNAKTFKPGQGVYRSSHKNALRLAKEEINTAYRESEQLRILQNNDVVGIEIHLSPSHKVYDICDELKGKYPKDFKWSKWHIGCMCHRRVIMKSEKEFINELKKGENLPPESSENYVSDVPNSFKKWHRENKDKFANWKRLPNFLEENRGYLGNGLPERYKGIEFETIYKGKKGGRVERFTSGKQNKVERVKNENALKILADKGYQYRLLPVIEDGQKNPDAFNIITKKYTDLKVTESKNGKSVVQNALKEANGQGVNEVVIQFTQELQSNADVYSILKTIFKNKRAKNIETITFITYKNKIIKLNRKRFE